MSVRAEVDQRDIAKLNKFFEDVSTYTKKNVDNMMDMTMRFAIQSAKNATRPRSKSVDAKGNRRGGNKLAKKYLFRPLVNMPASMGFWYTPKGQNEPFRLERNLSNQELTRRNLERVTKGIKKRLKKGWTYIPWAGKKHERKPFKIPHAGLAKDGWLRSLKKFTKDGLDNSSTRNKRTRNIHRAKNRLFDKEAINRVSYISKSSPAAARYGINRARKRLIGKYKPDLEKAIERRFNRI